MKLKIRDIMDKMDEIEKVEISDELIEKLREIFNEEIELEDSTKLGE